MQKFTFISHAESANCEDGAVQLKMVQLDKKGELKSVLIAYGAVSICGDSVDTTDAYVVCNELGLGLQSGTITL